jgi:thymidylate synthase ThyX
MMDLKLIRAFMSEFEIAQAAHVSQDAKPFDGSPRAVERLVRRLVRDGHTGPLEFGVLHLEVTAPIFVARHLVRYRHASWNERSLRYGPPIGGGTMEYRHALEGGERLENARASLPLATPTKWRWQVSIPTILHILEQRLTPEAQAETREIAQMLENEARRVWPDIIDEARYTRAEREALRVLRRRYRKGGVTPADYQALLQEQK